MKTFVIRTVGVVLFLATLGAAQDVIPLYSGTAPGSTQENYPEKEYFSKAGNTEVVTNVTKPSLIVFKPSPELRNGTAVVICPGGGFMALAKLSNDSLQLPQSPRLAHFHPAVLRLPAVQAPACDPVPPAQLVGGYPSLRLLQDGDDLFFVKATLAHDFSSLVLSGPS